MTLDDLFNGTAANGGSEIKGNLIINGGDHPGTYQMAMNFAEPQFSQLRDVQTLSGTKVLSTTEPKTPPSAMQMVITRTIANDVVHNPTHPAGPRESYQVVVTYKGGGVRPPEPVIIDTFTPELGSNAACNGIYFHSLIFESGNHPGGKPLIECCLTQS